MAESVRKLERVFFDAVAEKSAQNQDVAEFTCVQKKLAAMRQHSQAGANGVSRESADELLEASLAVWELVKAFATCHCPSVCPHLAAAVSLEPNTTEIRCYLPVAQAEDVMLSLATDEENKLCAAFRSTGGDTQAIKKLFVEYDELGQKVASDAQRAVRRSALIALMKACTDASSKNSLEAQQLLKSLAGTAPNAMLTLCAGECGQQKTKLVHAAEVANTSFCDRQANARDNFFQSMTSHTPSSGRIQKDLRRAFEARSEVVSGDTAFRTESARLGVGARMKRARDELELFGSSNDLCDVDRLILFLRDLLDANVPNDSDGPLSLCTLRQICFQRFSCNMNDVEPKKMRRYEPRSVLPQHITAAASADRTLGMEQASTNSFTPLERIFSRLPRE